MAFRRELRASSNRVERSPTASIIAVLAAALSLLPLACFHSSSLLEAKEPQKPDPSAVPATPSFYNKDTQRLFKAKCRPCHGDKVRKGSLDLRSRAGLLKGSESGPVIVPGKPDESLLYQMVRDGKMPAGKNEKLA